MDPSIDNLMAHLTVCQRIMHSRHASTQLPPLLTTPNMSASRLYQNIPPSLQQQHLQQTIQQQNYQQQQQQQNYQQHFHSSHYSSNNSNIATTPTNNNSNNSPFNQRISSSSGKFQPHLLQHLQHIQPQSIDPSMGRMMSSDKNLPSRRQQPPPPPPQVCILSSCHRPR